MGSQSTLGEGQPRRLRPTAAGASGTLAVNQRAPLYVGIIFELAVCSCSQPREHQDAYEFFTRLQDSVDEHLRMKLRPRAIHAALGGTFAQLITVIEAPQHRSERVSSFERRQLCGLRHAIRWRCWDRLPRCNKQLLLLSLLYRTRSFTRSA